MPRLALDSALYVGHTVHVRRRPAMNAFRYALAMAAVDLAELEAGALDCWPLFSSRTAVALTALLPADHLSGKEAKGRLLSERIREIVFQATGVRHAGRVVLLAGLRVLGLEFNPVSFYYFLDAGGSGEVDVLVAEVNNIPWFEQHLYILQPAEAAECKDETDAGLQLRRFAGHAKAFHVSPFMPIDGISYDWLVSRPGDRLAVRIGLRDSVGSFFSASIDMRRHPFSATQMAWLLLSFPLLAVRVVLAIMYEAGKLRRRGFRFYPHPDGAETTASRAIDAVAGLFVAVKERWSKPASAAEVDGKDD
jgi:uncharacterized protein